MAKASRWKEQDGLISKFWQMETGLRLRILQPRSADTKNLDEFIPEYWKLMWIEICFDLVRSPEELEDLSDSYTITLFSLGSDLFLDHIHSRAAQPFN